MFPSVFFYLQNLVSKDDRDTRKNKSREITRKWYVMLFHLHNIDQATTTECSRIYADDLVLFDSAKRELIVLYTNHRFACTFSATSVRRRQACRPVSSRSLYFILSYSFVSTVSTDATSHMLTSRVEKQFKGIFSGGNDFVVSAVLTQRSQGGRSQTNFVFHNLLSCSEQS